MKIGILSGTFDPVHEGHVAFALQAIEEAGLDMVFLAPEVMPRRKEHVTLVAQRAEMIRLAIAPHSMLGLLELPDRNFSVAKTMPRLEQHFPGDELFYLCGSDMIQHMPEWDHLGVMLAKMGLIVGVKTGEDLAEVKSAASSITSNHHVIKSIWPSVSSSHIREAIRHKKDAQGLFQSTREYIEKNHLYC